MKKRNKIEIEDNDNNSEVITEEKETIEEAPMKKGIKKTVFYIFYEIFGLACIILLILTLFDGPKDFILDRANIILGIGIMVYSILFLLPYTFKKKETKWINLLTMLELALIVFLGFVLVTNKEIKHLNISRTIGLVVYIFGLVEIVRGYHSNGGIKIFKSSLLNGLIKYFNIFLITLGTYIFFDQPFDKYLLTAIRICLIALAIISIFIGLLKMPKKKK